MSKSVLVIDTPKTCVDCIFCQEYRTKNREYAYCYVTNGDSENDMKLIDCIYGYRQSKPDWCPLKPLPEKFDNEKDRKLGDFKPLFKIGWNACLREITGEVK
jgi:hypothetical protein